MGKYKGIESLRVRLAQKSPRIATRYKYYDMKQAIDEFGSIIPENFKRLKETLGWCGKAVDSLADRLVFDEFISDNFGMGDIFNMNNKDVMIDSAIRGALIASCSFVYISSDENGFPRLQVIDGADATGYIDPFTNMLTEGYAVLDRDKMGNPETEVYFTAESTVVFEHGIQVEEYPNPAPYPLLVPIIYKPSAKRPFGHSRISRSCMDITQSALRTLKRAEVSAEFYSFPQKYITGLDPNAEQMDKLKATMSSFLQFDKDEDGDKPTLGQFSQQSMTPYTEQLKMLASLFAGETGLTLDDLGFATDNPSSAEAIKASHETLRLMARKAQRDFSVGFRNTGFLARCVRDNMEYKRNEIYATEIAWEPIFEPDMSTLSLIGDGALKINQAVPGYFGPNNLKYLTGIKGDDGNG